MLRYRRWALVGALAVAQIGIIVCYVGILRGNATAAAQPSQPAVADDKPVASANEPAPAKPNPGDKPSQPTPPTLLAAGPDVKETKAPSPTEAPAPPPAPAPTGAASPPVPPPPPLPSASETAPTAHSTGEKKEAGPDRAATPDKPQHPAIPEPPPVAAPAPMPPPTPPVAPPSPAPASVDLLGSKTGPAPPAVTPAPLEKPADPGPLPPQAGIGDGPAKGPGGSPIPPFPAANVPESRLVPTTQALPPTTAEPANPVACPWTLKMEIVKGRTELEARIGKEVQFRVTSSQLSIEAPRGCLNARGDVKITGSDLDGSCEGLTINWQDDHVFLEGKAHLKCLRNGQDVELNSDKLSVKLSTSSSVKGTGTRKHKQTEEPPLGSDETDLK
jgi:hypothetical protein